MFEKTKDHLNEVINMAEKCPEKYQVKCFEILLDALVKAEAKASGFVAEVPPSGVQPPSKPKVDFFLRYSIPQDEWERVFHFDGVSCSIIAKDLKEKTVVSKKQVKLALLLGIKSLLESGEASISRESLINICKEYAAYDVGNFSANMKKAKNLFLPKGPKGARWVLTVPGQEKAAEVIKELAK